MCWVYDPNNLKNTGVYSPNHKLNWKIEKAILREMAQHETVCAGDENLNKLCFSQEPFVIHCVLIQRGTKEAELQKDWIGHIQGKLSLGCNSKSVFLTTFKDSEAFIPTLIFPGSQPVVKSIFSKIKAWMLSSFARPDFEWIGRTSIPVAAKKPDIKETWQISFPQITYPETRSHSIYKCEPFPSFPSLFSKVPSMNLPKESQVISSWMGHVAVCFVSVWDLYMFEKKENKSGTKEAKFLTKDNRKRRDMCQPGLWLLPISNSTNLLSSTSTFLTSILIIFTMCIITLHYLDVIYYNYKFYS